MITESELKCAGMQALSERLGIVDSERFVALLLREPFDYTEWQRDLYSDMSYAELRDAARKFREKKMKNKTAEYTES
jgi:hypothetical protein